MFIPTNIQPQYFKAPKKALLLLSIIITFSLTSIANSKEQLKTVAITQIVAHPSLDKVRNGVIQGLKAEGYIEKKNLKIIFANAHGNITTARQIATKFVSLKPDVIVAIATPSAQAAANATKDIPIIFATVTAPIKAKLVSRLEQPGGNITGTRNKSPIDKQLKLIKKTLPNVQNIGIIYSSGEDNSIQLIKAAELHAKEENLTIITANANNSNEVPSATNSIIDKVDCLFLLQDNTTASALPSIIKIANKSKKPVFASYVEAVEKGALMGLAYDEFSIGEQTGKIVARILKGEQPGSIDVEDPEKVELEINDEAARLVGIEIDQEVTKDLVN